MGHRDFTDDDVSQIEEHGLTMKAVQRHLELFQKPQSFMNLLRPCTAGDGIKTMEPDKVEALIETYENEVAKGGCLKFVPASGAASRMFKTLLHLLNEEKEIMREPVEEEAGRGDKEAREVLKFMNGVRRFAFFEDLGNTMLQEGLNIDTLLETGRFSDILRFLLSYSGLNYANLPKGLLKFHWYPEGARTAFEEHLVEAVSYVSDLHGGSLLHFTVSQEHMEDFQRLIGKIRPLYEGRYQTSFHMGFSTQKRSTDTLAVDSDNMPFRLGDGKLLFRPGGHGALIENLNDLDGNIVFIKNIDNVVPDRFKPETFRWKKTLGGYLVAVRDEIFGFIRRLSAGSVDGEFLDIVTAFLQDKLCLTIPGSVKNREEGVKRKWLLEKLNRPIKVCGMVKNEGEPGGGPFWVRDETGESSLQIVETAQIDPESKEQQDIFSSSTHFNPVDLVCSVRDFEGNPFDLTRYVDENAVFISKKSKDGKDLKALEHPGLWNGAMAKWITLFVEVPIITFNPVKTVNDLLRKEHQPG